MPAGMATIASGVMAVYANFGIPAGHLLTASVLSAPAALLISKVMLPETESSETSAKTTAAVERTSVNSIDALCRGASEGVALAINVLGMLIAFVAVVALLNYALAWTQRKFGVTSPITFQNMLGWINSPFAWLMGIPVKDCALVGQILGERVVLNEFIGYLSLTKQKANLDQRSFVLATYALCGFANFSSIAIQIGGIGALAPNRRGDLARLGLRAMVAGLLACYVTASVSRMKSPFLKWSINCSPKPANRRTAVMPTMVMPCSSRQPLVTLIKFVASKALTPKPKSSIPSAAKRHCRFCRPR